MATRTASAHRAVASAGLCQPEEDPILLLICTLRKVEAILQRRRGRQPLRRSWIDEPYGEEEFTTLLEEVLPGMRSGLAWIEELDQRLLCRQELLERCRLEAERDALLARPLLGLS
jgi:hypothetical protein